MTTVGGSASGSTDVMAAISDSAVSASATGVGTFSGSTARSASRCSMARSRYNWTSPAKTSGSQPLGLAAGFFVRRSAASMPAGFFFLPLAADAPITGTVSVCTCAAATPSSRR